MVSGAVNLVLIFALLRARFNESSSDENDFKIRIKLDITTCRRECGCVHFSQSITSFQIYQSRLSGFLL